MRQLSYEERQERRERLAREQERLIGSRHESWGAGPPRWAQERRFVWAERGAQGAGWAAAAALLAWGLASPWQGWGLLWQAPLGLAAVKAARVCSRMALLGALAGGPREGFKAGVATAARMAQAGLGLGVFLCAAAWVSFRVAGADVEKSRGLQRRLSAFGDALGLEAALDWLWEGSDLEMARRLGPVFAWSVARRRSGEHQSEWFLWDLWSHAPFDPSWPVSGRWGREEPAREGAGLLARRLGRGLGWVFGSWLRPQGRSEEGEQTLMSLAERSRARPGPPAREAPIPDPVALGVALERERLERATRDEACLAGGRRRASSL